MLSFSRLADIISQDGKYDLPAGEVHALAMPDAACGRPSEDRRMEIFDFSSIFTDVSIIFCIMT
jgi:hypothetical protein